MTNKVHPGIILLDMLKEDKLSVDLLAERINVDKLTLNKICSCENDISMNMANKLAMYFGTSMDLWLNLQNNYREAAE